MIDALAQMAIATGIAPAALLQGPPEVIDRMLRILADEVQRSKDRGQEDDLRRKLTGR